MKYDLLIIGGGATGSGIALDATLRGFKTILLEQNDFAEGTSSRSTKLVHGGVRYLEAAVKNLDKEQFFLVKEGLMERYRLLKNAPHLSQKLSLITPIYSWLELPYIFVGLKLYDLISGKFNIGKSKIISRDEIIKGNPTVKKSGLKAGVRYYDGAFNDARMVIALLQSAEEKGAVVRNYSQVQRFIFKDNKIIGVEVYDKLKNKKESFYAKVIVNATGVFSDKIRKLANPSIKNIIRASSGIHIVVDKKFLPSNNGLMIPKTKDGRVLFILPYLDKCLIGTTDNEAKVEEHPKVDEKDIEYLLEHINSYFDIKITKKDILSSFCGLRPLVDLNHGDATSKLVREHIVEELDSGLVTIAGGKWTTYRNMAEGLVDYILNKRDFANIDKRCKTYDYKVIGSRGDLIKIEKELNGFTDDRELIKRVLSLYGDKSIEVFKIAKEENLFYFIDEKYKILAAEVVYAKRFEFVKKAIDFIERRVLLSLIDKNEASVLEKKVNEIMLDIE